MKKRRLIVSVLAAVLLTAGCTSKTTSGDNKETEKVTINIGIQQSLGPLLIAKEKGWFEEEFRKTGQEVKWTVFQSGPPHFEALAANRLDFGAVGNSPVIAGQAAGIPFTEIALSGDGLKGNAILVKSGSPIQNLADLKGKKIAVAKGSSGFNLLYRALDQAGLKPEDVKIIQLQPDEAQPAFESGAVDAWSIWEPFISLQTITNGARVLEDGQSLHVYSPGFVIARTAFVKKHPELAVRFLKVYEKARLFEQEHREEVIDLYANAKKIDQAIIRRVLENNQSLNQPITKEIIRAQQDTADFQYSLKAITKQIDTSKVVDNSYIQQALKEVREEQKK
ncbi:aliphatic sulfonate ABC transporter substrate-binding protein [Ectobacillus ponti]|uniref:Putative aliphatic sulfonates-binding protein n=1 Tax=Ectobacillus ponti TaxID=2961894 RepID=A0AA41X897_9BACI|nr:aliphatic sulfonate ABC transporter substrate-binding protein [Ectobacillus ponti]MCP8967216.1 aliphatic sulfonate ABC transporter substrate-binding protein [Ectobacillus ponti]